MHSYMPGRTVNLNVDVLLMDFDSPEDRNVQLYRSKAPRRDSVCPARRFGLATGPALVVAVYYYGDGIEIEP